MKKINVGGEPKAGISIGIVGATGVVGETFMQLIDEREFPVGELRLFASQNSLGQIKKFQDREIQLQVLSEGCFKGLDLVFFSSGDDISREWAPRAVADGAFAVDNSGAFRMNPEISLVVPEINGDLLPKPGKPSIIANPNCSTIQLVMAIQPLYKKYGLKAVRVASYQSVSGAGRDGVDELFTATRKSLEAEEHQPKVFPQPIAFNCIPQIGGFNDDGFCTEEVKIMKETNKILRTNVPVSAFTVRVPTMNGHAEAAWITLEKTVDRREEIEETLANFDGVEVVKQNQSPAYPTQLMASGRDPVYVGRVHRDLNDPNTWLMWVVSDNLKKGAALNGIQIAERIFDLN